MTIRRRRARTESLKGICLIAATLIGFGAWFWLAGTMTVWF